MEIAKYILSIFKHYTAIVLSWGAHNFIAVEESEEGFGGCTFECSGFKFQGTVKVILNFTDTFDIYLIKNGNVVETINDIYLDQLVSVIDNRIEHTEDYEQRVQAEYNLMRAHA